MDRSLQTRKIECPAGIAGRHRALDLGRRCQVPQIQSVRLRPDGFRFG